MDETDSEALDLTVEFDAEEDALHISLGVGACGHIDQGPDGLLLRRSDAAARATGVTALDFRDNWLHRRPEFYSVVADYLEVPITELASMAEVVIGAHGTVCRPTT